MVDRPLIETVDLGKSFKINQHEILEVIRHLTLSVKSGEVIAIIGPSGCGKTTLLKILCGLLEPTVGEVRLEGSRMQVGEKKNLFSLVFQQPNLLPWFNVSQNVALPLRVGKNAQLRHFNDITESVDHVLHQVALADFAKMYPDQLSGGMKSRVALARAIVSQPRILLLDEPFGALDALTREDMQHLLLHILDQTNATAILVTHSIEEAVLLADRIIILSKRPATSKHEICIPLGRPRTPDVRFDKRLVDLRKEVLGLIFDEDLPHAANQRGAT